MKSKVVMYVPAYVHVLYVKSLAALFYIDVDVQLSSLEDITAWMIISGSEDERNDLILVKHFTL